MDHSSNYDLGKFYLSEFAAEDKLFKSTDELILEVPIGEVVANIFKEKVEFLKIEAEFNRRSDGNRFHLVGYHQFLFVLNCRS